MVGSHVCEILVELSILYSCLACAHSSLYLPAPCNVSDCVASSSQDQCWKTKAFDILDTLTKQQTVLQ